MPFRRRKSALRAFCRSRRSAPGLARAAAVASGALPPVFAANGGLAICARPTRQAGTRLAGVAVDIQPVPQRGSRGLRSGLALRIGCGRGTGRAEGSTAGAGAAIFFSRRRCAARRLVRRRAARSFLRYLDRPGGLFQSTWLRFDGICRSGIQRRSGDNRGRLAAAAGGGDSGLPDCPMLAAESVGGRMCWRPNVSAAERAIEVSRYPAATPVAGAAA